MQRLIPSETALVLGGGGAKGAYEIGAIEALEALGIRAGSAFGTSIGALHAAMYAQGSIREAADLWKDLQLSDMVTPESLELAEEAEEMFDRADKLLEFITRNAQRKGVDTAPLYQLIRRHVDESAVRTGSVRFGLVATRFPSLSPVQMHIGDMEAGSLCDWLMASCACFPAFPMKNIGDHRYIDGGFSDNVPVDMAIRAGARHIIAIDIGKKRAHAAYDRRPNITYIRASHPLGGLLSFNPDRSARNRILGYNDTLRTFGKMRGTAYSFDPIDAQALYTRAQDFVVRLTHFEAALRKKDEAPLFSLLEDGLKPGADVIDYYLRAGELCASMLDIEPAQVFTFSAFTDALRLNLPLDKADAMLDSLLGGRIGVLFAPPQPDKKLILACLYHLIRQENGFSPLTMRTLSAFPKELLCALTLSDMI